LLAGLVEESTRWRWIFYLNVPLGIAVLVVLGIFLPKSISSRSNEYTGKAALRRIDFLGAALSAGATVTLLLGLTWGSGRTYAWDSSQVLVCFACALVLFSAFFLAERRALEPILPLDLFKNRVFAAAAAVSFLQMMALIGLAIYLPFYMQRVLGVSATGSGAATTPMNLASVLGATLGSALFFALKRHRPITLGASALLCLGAFFLTTMTSSTSVGLAIVYMVLAGLGVGPFFSVLMVIAQNALPPARLGIGTSVLRYLGQLGSVLGATIVGTAVNDSLSAGATPELAVRRGFIAVFAISLAMLAADFLLRENRQTEGPSSD
jgi:predicted MFS family arabinose efflux permease